MLWGLKKKSLETPGEPCAYTNGWVGEEARTWVQPPLQCGCLLLNLLFWVVHLTLPLLLHSGIFDLESRKGPLGAAPVPYWTGLRRKWSS